MLQNITWKESTNQKVSDWGYCSKFWINAGTEARKCVKIVDFQKCGVNAWMSQKCVNFMANAWYLAGLHVHITNFHHYSPPNLSDAGLISTSLPWLFPLLYKVEENSCWHLIHACPTYVMERFPGCYPELSKRFYMYVYNCWPGNFPL